jgi:hypothetical protein
MKDTLTVALLCIVVVGVLAFATMGPEIKAATNAEFEQRGWKPVFEEPAQNKLYTCSYSLEMDEKMATATGVTTGLVIKCTLEYLVPDGPQATGMMFTPFTAIGMPYIELQYSYSVGDEHHFDLDELPALAPPYNGKAIVAESGEVISIPITTTVTNLGFASEHSSSSIGEKGTTHAKECQLEEAWAVTGDTQVIVEVEGLDDIVYDWPDGTVITIGTMLCDFTVEARTSDWTIDTAHCAFRDISVGIIDIDTSELDDTWGSSDYLHVKGNGSDIEFYRSADAGNTWRNHSEGILMPRAYSFAGLDVIDRDGNSYQDALVWNTGVREWDSEGDPINPVCKTVAQWQAYDHTQAKGCYSWEKGLPDLNANVTLYLDRDWARGAGLDGFTADEYATKSFGHDARIIINGWTIDKEDRDCVPYRDDILSIAHKSGQSIYADDQDHTDWTSNGNCSDPDNDGDFSVTAAGAVQTFTLKNNREARLGGLVQALQAPAGVPDAYITYRHDYYLTADNYPETTHESIYCWKGWRYLYMQIKPPLGEEGQTARIALEIDYYDSESHSDPHVSDSTRQTDYSYSLGEMKTRLYTKDIPMDTDLFTNVCFDLGGCQPMYIVKEIRLKLGVTGGWTIDEPRLALDTGDVLAEREFVSPHCYAKEFEHWAYRRGGISAVVDGVARGSIEWPDTSHENTIEHTGGHFDYVVGATSGIDLTNAVTLAGYASWMNQCSDAWNAGVNSTNALAATSDGTNSLKTLSAYDVIPANRVNLDTGSFQVAIRVGQFVAAPGIHYTFEAQKITGGKAHGCMYGVGGRSATDIADWLRRLSEEDEWTVVATGIDADANGYWETASSLVYSFTDDEGTLWTYALGDQPVGRLATREWALVDFYTALSGRQPFLCLSKDGQIWLICNDGYNNIAVYSKSSPTQPWERHTAPWSVENHEEPAIAALETGQFLAFANKISADVMEMLTSSTAGEDWKV